MIQSPATNAAELGQDFGDFLRLLGLPNGRRLEKSAPVTH
jgi:hypothetical protein